MRTESRHVPGEARVPDRRPAPLRAFGYRDFRLLWSGLLIGNVGTWMQFTALGYYVATLAPNAALGSFYVGLIGASRAVPVLVLSPLAGVVADRFPRKAVLLATNTTIVVAAVALALAFVAHAHLSVLMAISMLAASAQSFDAPARQSWVPIMVPKELVSSAIGLNSIAFNAPSVVGPPIAGLVIAGFGVAPCAAANAVLSLAVVLAVLFMRPAPPSSTARTSIFVAIAEGVRFLYRHPVLRWVILVLLITSVTVRPYNFLLPAYAVHIVHTDARGLGVMMAASGAGAIGGALFTAAVGTRRRGRRWFLSAALMSVGVGALGLTDAIGPASASLVVIGLATLSFITNSNVLIQTLAPDEMRGRAISVYSMVILGLVPLGSLLVGAIAAAFDLRGTFVAAGAISLAISLWTYFAHPTLRAA